MLSSSGNWTKPAMPSSAAQPAEYLQGDCAVQPVRFPHSLRSLHPTSCARLDFYNIGWIYGSKKRRNSRERLVGEVMNIVKGTSADAIGLSEVFNVLKDELYDTRQEIMAELLQALNGSTEQPVWDGRADVHYIFLWNTSSLQLRDYEVVSCCINDHPWRKAQYIQFTTASDGEPLHIYHNHSPSNQRGGKHLTLARRKSILVNLWEHVRRRSNAEQPAVVFGGDYNCTPVEWALCFTALKSHLRSVQVCTSKSIPCHKGDRAVAINVRATGGIIFRQELPRTASLHGCPRCKCWYHLRGAVPHSLLHLPPQRRCQREARRRPPKPIPPKQPTPAAVLHSLLHQLPQRRCQREARRRPPKPIPPKHPTPAAVLHSLLHQLSSPSPWKRRA